MQKSPTPRKSAPRSSQPGSLGSARKEAKAAEGSASRKTTGIHSKGQGAANGPRPGQVAVRTPNVPGASSVVDAEKYGAMKDILLAVIPSKAPGITQGEMFDAVHVKASKAKFPGSTSRWWAKVVQLDLETKGVLRRIEGPPLRWHRK